MIRRFIELLLFWKVREEIEDKSPLQTLEEVLPLLYAATVIVGAMQLFPKIELSFFQKIRQKIRVFVRFKLKWFMQRIRAKLIGY